MHGIVETPISPAVFSQNEKQKILNLLAVDSLPDLSNSDKKELISIIATYSPTGLDDKRFLMRSVFGPRWVWSFDFSGNPNVFAAGLLREMILQRSSPHQLIDFLNKSIELRNLNAEN